MAMGTASGSDGGRRSKRSRSRPISDINVTPMVDVMLVLLIVFMVTAPLLTVGVQVDLPQTQSSLISDPDEPLAVSIDAAGAIFLQDTAIELPVLAARLIAITGANPDIRIFVRGDKNIGYGRVMQVMSTINRAGFKKVALITQAPRGDSRRRSTRPKKPAARK